MSQIDEQVLKYLHKIYIYITSSQKILGVLMCDFRVFWESKRRQDAQLAKTMGLRMYVNGMNKQFLPSPAFSVRRLFVSWISVLAV